MKCYEYGTQHPDVIVLLHGGGLCWWNYRDAASLLQHRYHVVLPVLDGHAGSGHAFESIEDNARRIIDWIDLHYGGQILALGGLSLGAQIAVEMLAQRPGLCRYALIESASLIPSKLTGLLIGPAFSACYPLISQSWFARLQFSALHIRQALYEDYYRDTCCISRKDLTAFMAASTAYALPKGLEQTQARLLIAVGGKEQYRIKQSAMLLGRAVQNAAVHTAKGLYHGELSLNHPDQYVQLLTALITGDR